MPARNLDRVRIGAKIVGAARAFCLRRAIIKRLRYRFVSITARARQTKCAAAAEASHTHSGFEINASTSLPNS
jgi:hypothetical protein